MPLVMSTTISFDEPSNSLMTRHTQQATTRTHSRRLSVCVCADGDDQTPTVGGWSYYFSSFDTVFITY